MIFLKVGYPGYILTRFQNRIILTELRETIGIYGFQKKIPNSLMPNYGEIEEYLEGIPKKALF